MGYIGLVNHQTYTKVLIWVYIKINCCVAACGISSRENSEGKEIFAISCDVANIQFVEKGGLEMSFRIRIQPPRNALLLLHS